MEPTATVRLDKWLWASRVYRTRSLATEACRAGHVRLAGHRVKPAHPVKVGETLTVQSGELVRTLRVVGLVDQRVGAGLVPHYLADLTPPAAYQQQRERSLAAPRGWPQGQGRPTKKARRLLDRLGWGAGPE